MSKKYDFEFKLKVVEEYLDGQGGIDYLTKKYSLTSHTLLKTWLTAYKRHGAQGLFRSREKKKYDLQSPKRIQIKRYSCGYRLS